MPASCAVLGTVCRWKGCRGSRSCVWPAVRRTRCSWHRMDACLGAASAELGSLRQLHSR